MDIFEQDVTIPIYIILQYDFYTLKFPVNPSQIKKDIASSSTRNEIEGIGEISDAKIPSLAKITIESFFWQKDVNFSTKDVFLPTGKIIPTSMYVTWLERWQKSKKPANLIVTRLNYSMLVTCENFSHWINAGEENDIYFTLELLEYRPHKAKKLGFKNNLNVLTGFQKLTEMTSIPILVDVVKPTRNSVKKQNFENPYVTQKDETIQSITKKITGSTDDWKSLYEENKTVIGDIYSDGSNLKSGTKLKLPENWISNSAGKLAKEILWSDKL